MTIHVSIDRFEGRRRETAVLLTEDGRQIDFPRDLLPEGAKAGDVLSLDIQRDTEGTKRLRTETRKLQDELKRTDPGGDIEL